MVDFFERNHRVAGPHPRKPAPREFSRTAQGVLRLYGRNRGRPVPPRDSAEGQRVRSFRGRIDPSRRSHDQELGRPARERARLHRDLRRSRRSPVEQAHERPRRNRRPRLRHRRRLHDGRRRGRPVLLPDARPCRRLPDASPSSACRSASRPRCAASWSSSTAPGPGGFREKDRRLLEIFADYASISIQNLLDARRAYEVAKRDGLTGLYNERYLHLRLTQELSRISRDGGDLCVIFLDLDNLKAVNDRHGHLAGSQVLREVGYLLRRTVTDDRATLTRYGGDEFVLILPGHDMQEGMEVAQSIRNAIRARRFSSAPTASTTPRSTSRASSRRRSGSRPSAPTRPRAAPSSSRRTSSSAPPTPRSTAPSSSARTAASARGSKTPRMSRALSSRGAGGSAAGPSREFFLPDMLAFRSAVESFGPYCA